MIDTLRTIQQCADSPWPGVIIMCCFVICFAAIFIAVVKFDAAANKK